MFYLYHINVGNQDPIEIRDKLLDYSGKLSMFDMEKIICEKQIKVAVDRSIRADEMNAMIAKAWGIEVLLHMSGTHQIKLALDLLQITEDTRIIGIVLDKEKQILEDMKPGMAEYELNQETLDKYSLSTDDMCREIISRNVSVILDHQ